MPRPSTHVDKIVFPRPAYAVRVSDAKARTVAERPARNVVGGWEWWERVAATGGDRREPAKRDCGAVRCGVVRYLGTSGASDYIGPAVAVNARSVRGVER